VAGSSVLASNSGASGKSVLISVGTGHMPNWPADTVSPSQAATEMIAFVTPASSSKNYYNSILNYIRENELESNVDISRSYSYGSEQGNILCFVKSLEIIKIFMKYNYNYDLFILCHAYNDYYLSIVKSINTTTIISLFLL
jgi:hypothetical protein